MFSLGKAEINVLVNFYGNNNQLINHKIESRAQCSQVVGHQLTTREEKSITHAVKVFGLLGVFMVLDISQLLWMNSRLPESIA